MIYLLALALLTTNVYLLFVIFMKISKLFLTFALSQPFSIEGRTSWWIFVVSNLVPHDVVTSKWRQCHRLWNVISDKKYAMNQWIVVWLTNKRNLCWKNPLYSIICSIFLETKKQVENFSNRWRPSKNIKITLLSVHFK